jgi:hypothetical protein
MARRSERGESRRCGRDLAFAGLMRKRGGDLAFCDAALWARVPARWRSLVPPAVLCALQYCTRTAQQARTALATPRSGDQLLEGAQHAPGCLPGRLRG